MLFIKSVKAACYFRQLVE